MSEAEDFMNEFELLLKKYYGLDRSSDSMLEVLKAYNVGLPPLFNMIKNPKKKEEVVRASYRRWIINNCVERIHEVIVRHTSK